MWFHRIQRKFNKFKFKMILNSHKELMNWVVILYY